MRRNLVLANSAAFDEIVTKCRTGDEEAPRSFSRFWVGPMADSAFD